MSSPEQSGLGKSPGDSGKPLLFIAPLSNTFCLCSLTLCIEASKAGMPKGESPPDLRNPFGSSSTDQGSGHEMRDGSSPISDSTSPTRGTTDRRTSKEWGTYLEPHLPQSKDVNWIADRGLLPFRCLKGSPVEIPEASWQHLFHSWVPR